MKVSEAITEASVMAGLTSFAMPLAAEEGDYGLRKFNDMVAMFNLDRLTMYRRLRAGPFTVTANTQSYSVGSGATWDTPRPQFLDGAGIIYSPASSPVELAMNILSLEEY